METTAAVAGHYGKEKLLETILDALRAAGKDPERLTVEDLATFDHFHLRGRDATLELLRLAGLRAGELVLDVGGGIGGPARTLAEAGCSVTVLDLTEEFCRTGAALTERVALGARVTFRHASALDMPFEDGAFDAAWTQHSSMNIEDKEQLYKEIARVVRRGGNARHARNHGRAGGSAPLPGAVGVGVDDQLLASARRRSQAHRRQRLSRAGLARRLGHGARLAP